MSAVAENLVPAVAIRKITKRTWLTGLCLALSDCAAILIAVFLTSMVFLLWHQQAAIFRVALLPAASTLLVFAVLGLYPVIGLSPIQEFRRVLVGSSVGYSIA